MALNSLTNTGVAFINPSTPQIQKTFIVVGVARGGTSIVAGTLKHLGLFMGNANDPVFEDTRLSLAFEKTSKEKFETVIDDYNCQHDVWAWKRPSSLNDLPNIAKKTRNPYFIFVFRDLFSVANRNKISMKLGVVGGVQAAFDDYKKIVKFIAKSKHPALLVSSEKAVRYRTDFIDSIIDFSGLQPTSEQIRQAEHFISPEPETYLKTSRINRVTGWIDQKKLNMGILSGWAYQVHDKGEVKLSIFVNGEVIKVVTANDFHEDFKGKIHPTGECGFTLNLCELRVTPKDDIAVKAEGDDVNVCGINVELSHISQWLTLAESEYSTTPRGAINHSLLQTGILRGWALSYYYNTAAKVGIYVNGDKFAEVPASITRGYLRTQGVHPTGCCGYDFNLQQFGVKPNDELEVKLEGSSIILYKRRVMFPNVSNWLTLKELQEQAERTNNGG